MAWTPPPAAGCAELPVLRGGRPPAWEAWAGGSSAMSGLRQWTTSGTPRLRWLVGQYRPHCRFSRARPDVDQHSLLSLAGTWRLPAPTAATTPLPTGQRRHRRRLTKYAMVSPLTTQA